MNVSPSQFYTTGKRLAGTTCSGEKDALILSGVDSVLVNEAIRIRVWARTDGKGTCPIESVH